MLTIAARDGDSSLGSGQNKWKIFWKGFTIVNAKENIHDLWEKLKILTGVWKKPNPILMDASEAPKTSGKEVAADNKKTSIFCFLRWKLLRVKMLLWLLNWQIYSEYYIKLIFRILHKQGLIRLTLILKDFLSRVKGYQTALFATEKL